MNQYPGFVPMVVPQPYMVAMPTAIPMSGAVGPGLPALPQALHPQVAAAHVAGAPVVTSSVVTAPGMASAVRAAQLSQGVGQLTQGMGQLAAAQGMGHLAAQGMGQHLGMAGMPPHPSHHQGPMSLPTAKVMPHGPSMMGVDSRKRPWGSEMDKGKGGRFDNRWQSNPEQDVEEPNIDDSICVLDHFNSDLNLCIDPDGFGASVLLDPPGFCFTWAGARATHGVCKGKAYYEVHILEHLPVDFGEDHQELDPHVVRVGWSIDSSSFQLGEEPWSFGYGGTGKFSTNCRFSDYGQRFGAGDVIGAMLDLESRPASISFLKNGTWFGVAIPLHGFPVGSKDMALYPHILLKNCKVKVNFGQMDAWFPPPQGFTYVGQLPVSERVRGMKSPERKADCEMIMIVGLPGVGKTTWGINMQKSHPEKRYNIIGTDTLIDKMRVMGLPRKRNYHGRWEVLIDKATKCLNKLFQMGGRRKRNYILDQTNVYASARRRKMKFFKGFFRIAGVLQPEDHEMERRSRKRTVEDGKVVPESAVMEMKANFSIPEERDNLFDRIDFIELPREKVVGLVEQYVKEGQEKRPPREEVFRHDSRFQKNNQQNTDYGQQGSRPGQNQTPYGQRAMMGGPPSKSPMMGGPSKSPMGQGIKPEPQWFSEGDGLLGKAPNQMDDVPSKRLKLDQGGMGRGQQQGGALDLLKQQYDEAEQQDSSQWNQSQSGALQPQDFIKEERHWPPQDTAMAVGSGIGVHGTPLSHHLATQAGALVVSHPPGTIPLAGALGAQPPPPPPPVLPGHLAQTAAGHAFVALTPLPPPGPPPAVVAVGGAGALGGTPPGFHAQLQQMDNVGQPAWSQGGIVGQQSSWQQSESRSSNTSTPNQSGPDGSILRREWAQQVTDRQQGGWQGGQQRWQDQMGDSVQKGGQQAWQRDSGSQQQPWQGQEGSHDGSDKGGQQPWQGGSVSQQQYWQGQERSSDRGQKGWQGSDSNTEGGNSWMQNQGAGDGGRSYDEGRDKYGGIGDQRDVSRHGGYDSKMPSYGGDSSGRRFDDFSRPPPDARGGGRSDDFHGGDSRGGRSYGSNSQSFGDGGGNDRWGSHQRSGSSDRWSSSSSHQDRHGPSDSGESRWSGGGRQDGRDQGDRWGSRGQDRFSGGRDHDRGRDMDRGRDRDRGNDRERERDRDRGSERDRDRGGDRDRSGRDRDRDQDRDSYRDSYRDRERDRGSRDRDHDSNEPRQRRRKSKWDNPEDEAGSKTGGDSSFQQPPIKEELPTSGFGDRDPSSFQGGQQQNQQFFNRPGQYQPQQSEGNDGQNTFPSRGMGFNRPPPTSATSPGGPSPGQAAQVNFPKDRPSDLPSLLDVQFGNHPPPPPAANLDRSNDNPKSGASETSLLGPVPSTPPPRFQGNTGGPNTQSQTSSMPNTSVPPPRDGPPPPPFGGGGSGGNRPPFQPGAGPRFSGPNTPEGNAMSGGQRPGFRMEGPPRPMRPRNPQNFGGPPGSMGQMGGPPPNAPWNQNRFGGGRGMPPRPRFDGPGGGRFPGGPGPMRWPRGPR